MSKKRVLSMVLALAMTVGLTACKSEKNGNQGGSNLPAGEVSYPIKEAEGMKLTYWKDLDADVSKVAVTENDTEFYKYLEEGTGIEVEFIHPPAGQAAEKFNLMLTSGDLPDIFQYNLSKTAEGAETLVKNGYVYPLTEDFLKNYMPNYWKRLQEDEELRKSVRLNDGTYYAVSSWRESDSMTTYAGPMIRQDWLEDLGLDMPETIDDWYVTLKAFKEKKGATAPFTVTSTYAFVNGVFTGAYGTNLDFYVKDGKITHGVYDKSLKDFVVTMNKWYNEGLIDKDFPSINNEQLNTKMLTGKSGATYGMIGSGMGALLAAAPDETYKLAAAPYPALKKGGVSEFGQKSARYNEPCFMISATSPNKELAARFLDYGFTEEGHMLYNFGREGVSYEMVDGIPTFTELITNNPEGISSALALSKYAHCTYMGAYEMDERFFKQQYAYQEQKDAIDVWKNTNAKDHFIVDYNAATAEEQSEIAKYLTDINIHISENVTKFIAGIRPISEWDKFIEEVKGLNIDKVLELKQNAYDRYQSR